MPGNQGDAVGRLQGREAVEDNIEAALITRRQGNDVMPGTASPGIESDFAPKSSYFAPNFQVNDLSLSASFVR